MRKLILLCAAAALAIAARADAQAINTPSGTAAGIVLPVTTNPTGSCIFLGIEVNISTGQAWTCVNLTWTALSGGSGSTWPTLAGGTNTSSAFVVGSGASLTFTGTGTINAGLINGAALSALATGILKNTTGTGVPSIAVAGTDYVLPSGNVATATALAAAPTLCSSGSAPTGILASGNATGCQTIPTLPTFEVNGTALTAQAPINFLSGSTFNGLSLTMSNPSAGGVELNLGGALTSAGLAASGVTAGTCGGATQFCAPTFNAAGQATGYTSGNVQPFLSQSPDCAVTVTSTTLTMGANATATTPCNARIGTDVYSLTAPATATVSVCPASNTANYVYLDVNGNWTLGTNTGVTAASTAQFVIAAGTTAFPNNVIPIATVSCNNNAWVTTGGVVDDRAFISQALTPSASNGLTNPSSTTIGENIGVCPGTCTIQTASNSATGTTASKLVRLTGAPSTAQIQGTADTAVSDGICIGGCGTTGTASIAKSGQTALVFDNATTAGDYFTASTATAGDGHDAGTTCATGVDGKVLSTNAAAGTYQVVFDPAVCAGSGGGAVSSVSAGNSSLLVTPTTGAVIVTGQRLYVTESAATYSVASTDAGAGSIFTSSTGVTVTLPVAGSTGWGNGVTYHVSCEVTNYNTCVFNTQSSQTILDQQATATSITLLGNSNGGQATQSGTFVSTGTGWFLVDVTPTTAFGRSNNQYATTYSSTLIRTGNGITLNNSGVNTCSTSVNASAYPGEFSPVKLTGDCTLNMSYYNAGTYTALGGITFIQDSVGGHRLICGTGWRMACPSISLAPNAVTVVPTAYSDWDSSGLTNGASNQTGTHFLAGAAISAGQLVCMGTAALQVVPCATTATNTFVGFAAYAAASAAGVIVQATGMFNAAILDSGTCAVGNWVIAGTTTAGSVKCVTSAPTALTQVGFAATAQSTVGSTFSVVVDKR
jgi:hypothetical protein